MPIVTCAKCAKTFKKTPYEIKKSKTGNHFCSRTCAASYNNKYFPKRKLEVRLCKRCGKEIARNSYKNKNQICQECRRATSVERHKSKTIGEYRESLAVKGKHPSWVSAHVRIFCRSWNKDLTVLPCQCCGYDKHIELCHIKPTSSFPSDAPLGEVNDPSNILVLCRNCHWEYDHNILDPKYIKKR